MSYKTASKLMIIDSVITIILIILSFITGLGICSILAIIFAALLCFLWVKFGKCPECGASLGKINADKCPSCGKKVK